MSEVPRWSLEASRTTPWGSGPVLPAVECVLAPNPSPMTLDGTNTWLIGAPGEPELILIDPGPDDDRQRQAVREAAQRRGARVSHILLTHGHSDHSAGARAMAQEWGVGVRALDPAHRLGAEGLGDGDSIVAAGIELNVLATPGHTGDSLSLVLREASRHGVAGAAAVFTGDTVLGRGTAVIAHPDGNLAAYLASLARLRRTATDLGVAMLLPGHGPALAEPVAVIDAYLQHRQERLDAVRAALDSGATTVDEVIARVYADVDQRLWPAAALSVAAQLEYLRPPL